MRRLELSLVALLAILLVAPVSGQEPDQALEDLVWAKLKDAKLDKEVAEIIVSGDTVTLRGAPASGYVKMKAIEVALTVEGVATVDDELVVVAEAESDKALVKEIVSKVLSYPHYTVFDDIGFQLQDGGIVVLTGYVTMGFKKSELEERLGRVRGVSELKSVLQILPASTSDEKLRESLFRNIYGHELFYRYANRTNPPIHIIVDGPNVMLTGAVQNKIEKIKAESIVRSTFGVINIDNRLQIN